MKSAASSSEIRTIVRDDFKKYWTLPAMGLAWFFSWGLIPCLLQEGSGYRVFLRDLSVNENLGFILGILILGVGSGITAFSYLQHPDQALYTHSLPVSRGKLFAANILSGLMMIAGPILANGILMSLLAGNLQFVKWMIVTFVSCFAIFALTVLAAMVSGNVLMHLFNAAFFNGFVTVGLLVSYALCESLLYGFSGSGLWQEVFLRSNALTAFIGNEVLPRGILCLIYLIVGLTALAFAWACYKRRPVERTGSSVVFAWVRVMLFLCCVFFGALLSGLIFEEFFSSGPVRFTGIFLIGMGIGALLIFLIGSLMIDRSAKIFTRRNLLPACVALALAVGVSGVLGYDLIGYSGKVPQAGDIRAAYLEMDENTLFDAVRTDDGGFQRDYRGDARCFDTKDIPTASAGDVRIMGMRSRQSIAAVQAMQRALIAQDRDKDYAVSTIAIIYDLKNGHRMRRSYEVYPSDRTGESAVDVDEALRDAARSYYESEEFKRIYSLNNLRAELFSRGTILYYPDFTGYYEKEIPFARIPQGDGESLKAAMEKDFQELDYDDSMNCRACIVLYAPDGLQENILFPIPDKAVHTRAWIKKHGIEPEKDRDSGGNL